MSRGRRRLRWVVREGKERIGKGRDDEEERKRQKKEEEEEEKMETI